MLCVSFSICGCASDRTLAPDMDGELVTVTVKVPAGLVARDMQVIYRSMLCTFTDYTASGVSYQRYGYQSIDVQPVRQVQTDLYQAKLAVNGGGACQWRLSNVTFGIKIKDPDSFGGGVVYGTGGGVVVMFDGNDSGRGGADRAVDGDLVLVQEFYPWLHEGSIGGYEKSISLKGKGHIYTKYRAVQAQEVYFEPIVHWQIVAHSIEPKQKREGDRTIFYYPDGSCSPEIQSEPSFRKLQAIRLAAEERE